jgi:hypothetical protein
MSKTDSTPKKLTLMVAAETLDYEDDDGVLSDPMLQEQLKHARPESLLRLTKKPIRRELTAKTTSVDLEAVKRHLNAMQGELESLLKSIPDPQVPHFRLSEVGVGLSINAEAHIGIASAGAEVSLTLTFARE